MSGHPIFVVGSPRNGTTLMKDLLNGHSRVYLFNELHFFERFWDRRDALGDLGEPVAFARAAEAVRAHAASHGTDADAARATTPEQFRVRAAAVGGGYAGLLRAALESTAAAHAADHWGDSSPQDVLYLETLAAWYPDVRIVGMARDPRSFLASYKNYHRRAAANYRERYNPISNALLWRSYMAALLDAARGPLAHRIRVTRYEDVVSQPESEVRAVCAHVGIEFEPGMLAVSGGNSSYERGKGKPGVHTGSLDRWRSELTKTDIWLVERLCGPVMAELGYAAVCSTERIRPNPVDLIGAIALVPQRLFNMLFRSRKPFHWRKLTAVLARLSGSRGAPSGGR